MSSETTCLQNIQNVNSVICVPCSRNLLESTSCHLKGHKENVMKERLVLPYHMIAAPAYVKSTPPVQTVAATIKYGTIFVANTYTKECSRPNLVSSQTERKRRGKETSASIRIRRCHYYSSAALTDHSLQPLSSPGSLMLSHSSLVTLFHSSTGSQPIRARSPKPPTQ